MKTNNREFIYLRYVFLLAFFLICFAFWINLSQEIIFSVVLIVVFGLYIYSDNLIKKLYTDVRQVIKYTSSNQEKNSTVKDGDLGLLYAEIQELKERTKAYENTIQEEKQKLRSTIEDICHQLKTPLTSISIYIELLMQDNSHHQYLLEIDQQINKMNYLIQSLLKLAKLQSHQIHFEFERLPIQNVIDLSIESLHSLIKQTQISIHRENEDVSFYYDESWLQEALSNIIKNSLEQDCQNIDIYVENHQTYLKLFIHNDGQEISKKDLPHLFERFYHSSKQRGVGIGLALSKEIIEKHHGEIIGYNQDGVTFEMTFPQYNLNDKYKVS